MKDEQIKQHLVASVITVIAVTVMTILAELQKPFKDFLANTFYHHWIGKGILALIIFVLVAHAIRLNLKNKNIESLTIFLLATTLFCTCIIILFFMWEAKIL